MTRKDMARGLLEQARSSLESAKKAMEDGHWAFAVRSSQDATELSLKALLLTAGHEPPKVHDLGGAIRKNEHRLRELGLAENDIDALAKTAGSLAEDRSKSLYGDEKRGVPATELYRRDDASAALRAASDVHARCKEIVTRQL